MPSISDVARDAGVSTSTVSNFLNGRRDRMRQETCARIEKAIAELRYRPSLAARQLKTGHAPLLGLLVPSMANPMYALIAREIELHAQQQHGLRVMMGNTHRDRGEESRFIDDLLAHGVRGLVVISSSADESHLEAAAARGMAIVSYDRRATRGGTSAVDHLTVDNQRAAALATQCLVEQGHRRLAFVTPTARTMSRDEKVAGFLDAARQAGLQRSAKVVFCGSPGDFGDSVLSELGREQGRRFGATPGRPTGVVAVNDLMALGLVAGCRDAGLAVPRDISVVGMDDVFFASLLEPALTTVQFPLEDLARRAVDRVVQRQQAPAAAGEFVFQPRLVPRASVGPAP
ncbi:MAG TPA: LacI family DNA-binding transcriptional regulator [Ramlibacter sp.]|nr:LacI family DNA-binding transcriptional regulator [Ramlibacter sp.]